MLGALALQLGAYVYWDVAYVEAVKRSIGLIGSVVVVGVACFVYYRKKFKGIAPILEKTVTTGAKDKLHFI